MGTATSKEEPSSVKSPEASIAFSMMDVFLFSIVIGLLTYWFFFRKKKEEIPDGQSANENSFIEKMKKTGKNIVVFYGSQTGTAEEFANRLSKDAHRYGMRGMPADPEEYDVSDLTHLSEIEKSLAIFCMATYGEGDPTDNAQDFYDWLQDTDAKLSGIKYAVFGLGNKTYEHFNAMGKFVDKRLEELGAQRIFELGLGDDDGNLEEDFITWREQFWPAVCEHFGVEATGDESRPFDAKNPYLAPVTLNRKLNQGGERHLMHHELDITGSKIRGIQQEAPALYLSWVVESRRNILAILQDTPSLRPPIDHLCELLPRLQARYYSIASTSKVHPNSIHICSVVVEYTTKTNRVNKGVATNWLKNKQPNENGHKSTVPLYVRKSQFRLPFKPNTPVLMIGPGTGIAPFIGFIQERGWLKQQVTVILSELELRFEEAHSDCSLLQGYTRSLSSSELRNICLYVLGKEVGETVLYFGCRHEKEDYIYKEELAKFVKEGALTQLNVAFSRDQPEKIYVQHLLKKNKEHVWKLINEGNCHIYVCGDARNMARDVQNTFYEIVAEYGKMNQQQAVDYVKKLMTKGRYSLDVWS
ncbi:hypothetical protein Chor_005963 [Crotalus horridus]